MLSVKHIEENGYESITEAERVWTNNPAEDNGYTTTLYASGGSASKPDSHPSVFSNGSVYIMNDNGKTIGAYHF